jgi:hypothetical protein
MSTISLAVIPGSILLVFAPLAMIISTPEYALLHDKETAKIK